MASSAVAESLIGLPETHADSAVGNELLWKYGGDMRFFLVVGQVAILQMMHPAFTAVVAGNSQFFDDVWRRWFERTQPMLQRAVFDDQPDEVAHTIRDIHTNLKGVDDKGRHWHALNPHVFHYAHATQYYSIWRFIQLYDGRTLTDAENEAYYQATRRVWAQFGMRMDVAPPDWPSFLEYYDRFIEEHLEATSGAFQMLEFLASAPEPPIHFLPKAMWHTTMRPAFEVYVRISVGVLPPRARDMLGLTWTAEDERWLRRIGRGVARAARMTPEGIWITPEARAARYGRSHALRDRFQYLAGESVQRPIQMAWRLATR
ncbi:oxygenase MpaB family protein [Nocardia sp. NBC_01388]|uniref:oxygenase MpaB family protein n=1 Tax=Nocardia sp. NBC_01388 TaxID=2903596 RepID=UPI0032437E45